jgi:hypothetical protein
MSKQGDTVSQVDSARSDVSNASDAATSAATWIRAVAEKVKTKPTEIGKSGINVVELEPFYIKLGADNNYIVTVPSDIESFADDPAVVLACQAIVCLNAKVTIGSSMGSNAKLWAKCLDETSLYYYGAAAALHEGTVKAFPNYHGWFGRGYNFVIRTRLIKAGWKPWLIKGSEYGFPKVFSYKQWTENVPTGYKHLVVLVREAAQHIQIDEESAVNWLLPISALKGSKLKKKLPTEKRGFLLDSDIYSLEGRFKDQIAKYKEGIQMLSNPDFQTCVQAESVIQESNKAVVELEKVADRIMNERATAIYTVAPGVKRRKSKNQKLSDLILQAGPVSFLNHWSPCTALGLQPYSVSENIVYSDSTNALNLERVRTHFQNYSNLHKAYGGFLMRWFETEFVARFA